MKRTIIIICFLLGTLDFFAQTLTGEKHYYYHNFQSAENLFHTRLKQNPTDAETWLWLTRTCFQQDKLQQMEDSLSQAPVSLVADPHFLAAKGITCLAMKKKDSAAYFFARAESITKSRDAALLGAIAEAYIKAGEEYAPTAIALIEKGLKRSKNDPWLYTLLGNAHRQLHDGTQAYTAYQQAIEKNKHYAAAYFQLAKIFQTQKNKEMFIDFFNRAVAADNNYAPAYYELYYHYAYTEPNKAVPYFQAYTRLSDPSLEKEYAKADLLYLTKEYQQAIEHTNKLIQSPTVPPRLYKLVAYSHAELKDSAQALSFMRRYFDTGSDSDYIAQDYETMAELFSSSKINRPDSAMVYYEKAAGLTPDPLQRFRYFASLSNLAKQQQDYSAQAKWLGKYYTGNDVAGNVDLFNWGIAAFRAENYQLADTVFAIYTTRYPEQGFGYYWRAKSNAAIDTTMEQGLAVPHYIKLVEVIGADSLSSTNKKWITEAFGYLAAYETNTEKDYEEAISYFKRILVIDPAHETARKYIDMLEESIDKKEDAR